MKAKSMLSPGGNPVAQQIELTGDNGERVFQSYGVTVVAVDSRGRVSLDSTYWNYSKTTSKYRNRFLSESSRDIENKLASGEYILTDLN